MKRLTARERAAFVIASMRAGQHPDAVMACRLDPCPADLAIVLASIAAGAIDAHPNREQLWQHAVGVLLGPADDTAGAAS